MNNYNENNNNNNNDDYNEDNNSISTSVSDMDENQNENLLMNYNDNNNNNNNNNDYNNNNDNELIPNDKRKRYCYPPKLKNTFYFVIFLTIIGILVLVFSIYEIFTNFNLKSFICKIILSLFLLIPGLYYIILFIKAYCEKDEDKKNDIYNEIPSIDNLCYF
jgi:hypothetical protein